MRLNRKTGKQSRYMALALSMFAVAAVGHLTGCKSNTLPETPASEAKVAQQVETRSPKIDDRWYHGMDEETSEDGSGYSRAFELLRAHLNVGDDLTLKSSMHLGDWYVLSVNLPTSEVVNGIWQQFYVVDIASGRVVGRDEWQAVVPFFESLREAARRDLRYRSPEFVADLARFSAAVSGENNAVFMPQAGETYPGAVSAPRLRVANDVLLLTWYSRNDSQPPIYIYYQVQFTNGIDYEVSIVNPEDIARQKPMESAPAVEAVPAAEAASDGDKP